MSGRKLDVRAHTAIAAALICTFATASQAKDTIPTGAGPSPLFGALPFTQELQLFEEFGTRPLPTVFGGDVGVFPTPANCLSSPDGALLDAFIQRAIFPAPTREANLAFPNP